MIVLLDASMITDRCGYATVLRGYVEALITMEAKSSLGQDLEILYVVVQRRAREVLDPEGLWTKSNFIKIVEIPNLPTWARVALQQLCINAILLALRADVLHCPASIGSIMPVRPQLVFFHTATTFKVQREGHGRSWIATKLSNFLIKRSIDKADFIATTTNTTGEELQSVMHRKIEWTPIWNGVDKLNCPDYSLVSPHITKATESPYILYVSSFYRLKNHRVLIETSQKVGRKVILVGNAKDKQYYNECCEAAERSGSVMIFSDVTRADLGWLYKHADLYVCPSLFEGFALTPLEALQFGVPIVLSDLPVLREVYGDGFIYCDPSSVESVSCAVNAVDDEYRTRCKHSEVGSRYTWEKFAQTNVEIYRKLYARGGRAK